MSLSRFELRVFFMLVLAAPGLYAQTFPGKPIRMISTEPGGGADFAARLIAQSISGPLGQPVIVDNRGPILSIETAAKAPPDGYTLLFHGSTVWLAPLLQSTSYDPVRDFAPLTMVASSPNILVVHPSLPVKSVRDLVALARARPGELNYSSGPSGSSPHLAAELFKVLAKVKIVRIPYKGTGPALTALLGGEVQLMFATAATAAPHRKSGRLRALAVTSPGPSALLPGFPAIAESGLPGYESVSFLCIFAPAATPLEIIARLNQEIVRALNRPEEKEKFFNAGTEALGSTPEQLAATIKTEMARMGKVIKEAGIKAD